MGFGRLPREGVRVKKFGNHVPKNPGQTFLFKNCELFFPLQSPGSPRGGNPRKMEKNYKIPSPVQPPNMGKITEKLQKMYLRSIFCNFSVIFPHLRGLDRGGEFCNFSPFFGDSRPEGFRGSVRGKTTFLFKNLLMPLLLRKGCFPVDFQEP